VKTEHNIRFLPHSLQGYGAAGDFRSEWQVSAGSLADLTTHAC